MSIPGWQEFVDWLKSIFQSVVDLVTQIRDTLYDGFASLLNALNPLNMIILGAAWLAEHLPPALEWSATEGLAVLEVGMYWFGFLDYFVNLPVLVAYFIIVITVELSSNIIRGWRILRSLIT